MNVASHRRPSSVAPRTALALAGAVLVVLASGGCKLWTSQPAVGKSPLRPATASRDSVALEILFARFPHGDAELNGPAWDGIDEMQLSGDVRRELRRNGFRVGLVGAALPEAIAGLLDRDASAPADDSLWQRVDVERAPTVTRRLTQVRSGRHALAITSRVYERLPLLRYQDGQVSGGDLFQAQCQLAITPTIERDGRVLFELLPEIHHGLPRHTWSYQTGVMRPEMARPKEVLDRLRIATSLAPGQMLVITCLPDRRGSIGHYFFSDDSPRGREQKMLIIRLAQVPPSDLFADDAQPPPVD